MLARRAWALVFVATLCAACAHTPQAGPAAPKPDSPDPVARIIEQAEARLAAGLALLKDGHLNHARDELDAALDVYLSAPGGAYSDPRLAEAYRRTLETIQQRELEAVAAGDAYAEAAPEPAAIDAMGELAVSEERATDETRAKATEAVEEESNDFPVELNDAVLACVDLYQGRLRDWFEAALSRGQRYVPHIREVFASEGIPQDLAYVALVESAFKPAAYSRAKAKGVWQFMAATARRYGLYQDWWVDERADTDKATRAAAKYLKELYALFGDWDLALAGYNAGEAKVLRGIARYKTTDYWGLRKTRAFRRETRNYVPLIHAAIVVAKAPEKYGFEIVPERPLESEKVEVKWAVDLRTVAECMGTPVDEVRTLNPELRRLATPAGRTYELRVPMGRASLLSACLESLPPEKRARFRRHVVGRGQTLAGIARASGVRAQDLAEANSLPLNRRLRVGTELIIPIYPRSASVAPRDAAAVAVKDSSHRILYRIKPGDTLAAIASQYGTTVRELQSWNGITGSRIAAGATLTIYIARKF